MSDLYELFGKIRQKPPMYLGGRSIFQLESFYYGYMFARSELGITSTKQEYDFANFHSWLEERLDVKTTRSWASMILFRSANEIDALELFFQLLEEFITREKTSEANSND